MRILHTLQTVIRTKDTAVKTEPGARHVAGDQYIGITVLIILIFKFSVIECPGVFSKDCGF